MKHQRLQPFSESRALGDGSYAARRAVAFRKEYLEHLGCSLQRLSRSENAYDRTSRPRPRTRRCDAPPLRVMCKCKCTAVTTV
jgi:hypothetical protein